MKHTVEFKSAAACRGCLAVLSVLTLSTAWSQQNLTEKQKLDLATQMATQVSVPKQVKVVPQDLYATLAAARSEVVVVSKNLQGGLVNALIKVRTNGFPVSVFTDRTVVGKNPVFAKMKSYRISVYYGTLNAGKSGFLVFGDTIVQGNAVDPGFQGSTGIQGGYGSNAIFQNLPLLKKQFKLY